MLQFNQKMVTQLVKYWTFSTTDNHLEGIVERPDLVVDQGRGQEKGAM
jgi:hypothetical protein